MVKKNDTRLTICQVRTVTRALVGIWYGGGRCSRKRAEGPAHVQRIDRSFPGKGTPGVADEPCIVVDRREAANLRIANPVIPTIPGRLK